MPVSDSVFRIIRQHKDDKKALLAVLLDPDKVDFHSLKEILDEIQENGVHLLLVGSSQPLKSSLEDFLCFVKQQCSLPVLLFPGSYQQLSDHADALLFLSLISGRNPEYLIGQHVAAVPFLQESRLEIIPTGYILVDGGKTTSVNEVSQTKGINGSNIELITQTAKAGEWLGMKMIYLEAGSGALIPISQPVIKAVRSSINIPILVGGGIDSAEKARDAVEAGADIIVIGNVLEKTPALLRDIANAVSMKLEKVKQLQWKEQL